MVPGALFVTRGGVQGAVGVLTYIGVKFSRGNPRPPKGGTRGAVSFADRGHPASITYTRGRGGGRPGAARLPTKPSPCSPGDIGPQGLRGGGLLGCATWCNSGPAAGLRGRAGRAQRFNTVLNFRLRVGPWALASAAGPDGRFRTRLSALRRPDLPGSRPFSQRGRLDRKIRFCLEPQRFDGRGNRFPRHAARRLGRRGLDRLSC